MNSPDDFAADITHGWTIKAGQHASGTKESRRALREEIAKGTFRRDAEHAKALADLTRQLGEARAEARQATESLDAANVRTARLEQSESSLLEERDALSAKLAEAEEAVRVLGAIVRRAEVFVRADGRNDPPARYQELKRSLETYESNPTASAAVARARGEVGGT